MVKRQASCLHIPLEGGNIVQVDLKSEKISTCFDLRKYFLGLCSRQILEIKGPRLKVVSYAKVPTSGLPQRNKASQFSDAALGTRTGPGKRFPERLF